MGLDITQDFQHILRERAVLLDYTQEDLNKLSSASILPKIKTASPFLKAALQVAQSIDEGNEFIRNQRQKYTIAGSSTNSERDGIEEEIVLLIKTCSARIAQLQKSVEAEQNATASQTTPQGIAHMHGVTLILSEKLKDITAVFDKYRTMRFHHANDIKRRKQLRQARDKVPSTSHQANEMSYLEDGQKSPQVHPNQVQDMKFMEQENKALFDQLSNLSQEVHGTEKMVQEIATLNQMFSAQVLSQAEQIEFVYASAVEASMNIDHGNKQLKKAIKMNSSTRKYVLAVLLLSTFGLLFFHWFYS